MNTTEFSVPVTISVDPQRYGVKFLNVPGNEDAAARHRKVMDILVAHGLRAHLKTGNLLTGSLYVSVDFFPDAPPATVDWRRIRRKCRPCPARLRRSKPVSPTS